MKGNKLLIIGIASIMLSVIVTVIVAEYLKIDNPVFLKNYCEYPINYSKDSRYSNEEFQLKYITNIKDERQVINIVFEGLSEYDHAYVDQYSSYSHFSYSDYNNINEDSYGIYSLREVNVNLNLYFEEPPLENITLTNAEVMFNDGSSVKIDLGEIILYYENEMDKAITFNNSSSSSNHIFEAYGEVQRNIKVSKIYSPLFKYCNGLFKLFLGGNSYDTVEGNEYKVGDIISYNGEFINPKDIKEVYSIYNLAPKIYYVNDENKNYYRRILNLSYKPYEYNFFNIIRYLKAVGEI